MSTTLMFEGRGGGRQVGGSLPLDPLMRSDSTLILPTDASTQVTSCGINFPAPDRLTPARAAAHIWSW